MGAAEYEFGAVPNSLQQIVYAKSNPLSVIVVNNKEFNVLQSSDDPGDLAIINTAFQGMALRAWATKLGNGFHDYFEPDVITRLKAGCKKKTETVRNPFRRSTNFWWDIDNHFMVWPKESDLTNEILLQALRNLRDKNWNRPTWYHPPKEELIRSMKNWFQSVFSRNQK